MNQSRTTTLADTIKEWRLARKMSQMQLAEAAEVDQSFVSHVETGRNKEPSIDYLRKLANGLRVPLSVLLVAAGLVSDEEVHTADDPELALMIRAMRADPEFMADIAALGGEDPEATLRTVVASMRMQIRAILEDRERRERRERKQEGGAK